jgi:hypothetical protein
VLGASKVRLFNLDLGLEAGEPREASQRGSASSDESLRWRLRWGMECNDQTARSLLLPFLVEEMWFQRFSTGVRRHKPGQLSSAPGGGHVWVRACLCASGPAPPRGNSIIEIALLALGGTGSRSKLALEYFELAVMKANGNLACLQA